MPWRHTRVLWFTTAACRKHSRSSGISSKVGPEMREVDLSDTHLVVTGLWGAWWSSTLLTDGDSGCISGLGTGAPCSCRCSSHPSEECRKGLRRTRVFSTWLWSDRRRCSWAKARAMRGMCHRAPVATAYRHRRGLALVRLEELAQHAAAAVRSPAAGRSRGPKRPRRWHRRTL